MHEINAKGIHYRELNQLVRDSIAKGEKDIVLKNVNGQYYIGDGLRGNAKITIEGVPGNDLAAFMDGPTIIVKDNAQDNIGNTMNSGKVVIHGHAGDVLGYGMRGGKLHILGDVGYRIGIHMKGYKKQVPIIISGGRAGDFFGEYMAGGVLILLGLEENRPHPALPGEPIRKNGSGGGNKEKDPFHRPIAGDYIGTGMHGGVIFIRGEVETDRCGKEVGIMTPDEEDMKLIKDYLKDFSNDFGLTLDDIMKKPFKKLVPASLRPYGNLYAY